MSKLPMDRAPELVVVGKCATSLDAKHRPSRCYLLYYSTFQHRALLGCTIPGVLGSRGRCHRHIPSPLPLLRTRRGSAVTTGVVATGTRGRILGRFQRGSSVTVVNSLRKRVAAIITPAHRSMKPCRVGSGDRACAFCILRLVASLAFLGSITLSPVK